MYALSHQPGRQEESDDDDRPQAPMRHTTTSESTASHSATKTSGGGVAAAIRASRERQSSPKYYWEDDVEVEDSYEDQEPVVSTAAFSSDKAGMTRPGATFVGAVAVPGMPPSPTTTRYISSENENAYQHSFASRAPQAGQEMPETFGQEQSMKEQPIQARCVSDDDADVEAQVHSRMAMEAKDIAKLVHEQLMTNVTVPVDVQPSLQDTSSLTTEGRDGGPSDDQRKKKRILLIAVGVLAILVAIAVGVGVGVSKNKGSGQCSFCFDGSNPSKSNTNEVLDGQTCAEYRKSQIQLYSTDPACTYGQAIAWGWCECPTLPPPPKNPTCTLCEDGATPLGDRCKDYNTLVALIAGGPLTPSCDDLLSTFAGSGCTCPGPSPDGEDSFAAFQNVLQPISGDALNDVSTPQFQALNWIANEDAAKLSPGDTAVETRYVAAVLYYALEGSGWLDNYSFLSEGNICTWNQNGADGFVFGINCSSDGTVESLRLSENGLAGTIPQEIGYLSDLTNLDMANNTIAGTLPSSFQNLSRLEFLNFTENALTGTLPEFLYTHPKLKYIKLDDNHFTGTVSSSLGTSPQLLIFWLLNSRLSGTIPPSVGWSSTLASLDLSGNLLVGSIPEFTSSSNMQHLLLANNSLTGIIPPSTGNVPRLRSLEISNNTLQGSLPTELGNLGSLEYLFLPDNRLTGAIPTELGQCQNLASVDFDANYLRGDIGPLIESLPRGLESFDIGGNGLQGTIPASIGEFAFLGFFDVRSNNLNGTIPSEFGSLSMMTTLDLGANAFVGTVPVTLASLPNLERLSFYGNDLTGDLTEFCDVAIQTGSIESLAANTCGTTEEMECPCCTRCCSIDIFECRPV